MQISLIRHGRSSYNEMRPLSSNQFSDWVRGYDQGGVEEEEEYPSETLQRVMEAKLVVTSDLKRAKHSASLLGIETSLENALFREVELPELSILSPPMNPSVWAIVFRCLWFAGYSKNCESYRHAKRRAKKASQVLMDYAKKHESVALIGHGFFNQLIANELRKHGWEGKKRSDKKHWSCTTYFLENRVIETERVL
ncbi:histidine phosphatase family protein [Metabacillus iocasae]|uniref:Broad specificity phosphatase PhoE n=1 Tax=Priestia iocasae TaxID=2291674 RepID=A0ABS2QUX6_9BACI|nr:phosphoglycerate mutase family protein [Metabacillus iocasae]MBM7702787.1 broad specificity phosphatase PhoE [Metabacillus iocasae]